MSKHRKVKVWSPSGELKEVAPLNANDLVTHLGYSRTPPIAAAPTPAPEVAASAGADDNEVTPDPDGNEDERQAWLDNIGGEGQDAGNNEDEDEE